MIKPLLHALIAVFGAYAYLGLLVPEAHASPLFSEELAARSWEMVHGGLRCIEQVSAFGSWLELRLGGEPIECGAVHGAGIALFALAAVVVVALGRMRLVAENKRLELARRLLEQGVEPPRGLLSGPARNDLRRGLVLGFAGIGLTIAGLVLGDRGLAAGGLVPAFIGIGYLVSYRLAARAESP